jgi:hypothetical protein
MFIKLLIISAVFVALVFAFLGIKMLIRNGASFPETHISRNPEMRKLGISCAQKNDVGCTPSDANSHCCGCSSHS